jgi:catechol 2,3-dioxygenase-like lactoylglutathione lyase family enzyme
MIESIEISRKTDIVQPVRSQGGRYRAMRRPAGLVCKHPKMEMTLRFEIFPTDLHATVDFYQRVLGFRITADRRADDDYVALRRGAVRVGAVRDTVPNARAARRPPAGVELVLEVDDVAAERDRVLAAGWPLDDDLRDQSWGLRDFRVLDPDGYYLRITNRAS